MAYHFAHSEILPRRTLAAGGIVLLHLLVIYLLATALMPALAPAVPRALVAYFVPKPTPVVPTPNLTAPNLRGPTRRIEPLPVMPLTVPPEAEPVTAPPVVDPQPGPGAAVTTEPVRVVGRNVLPNSEDYYPADRRRQGIEGAALVRVCVDARGVRAGEPLIEASSQDAELDAAAVNVARHGRYARSEQGGEAVPNCYRFHITFRQTH